MSLSGETVAGLQLLPQVIMPAPPHASWHAGFQEECAAFIACNLHSLPEDLPGDEGLAPLVRQLKRRR